MKKLKDMIKTSKEAKTKPIKNQALLKRGGYSVAITALLLAVLILLNWLVSVLSSRFHLEFDISPAKVNTISKENIEYIENIEKDVQIIVCADEASYPSYMSYYAQYQGATGEMDYFTQTVNLVNKYGEYSDKLDIQFIDPQSTEFTEISNTYGSYDITYGDILVINKQNDRVKKVGFEDIYILTSDDTYSQYYGISTISGNDIETALTRAIVYVLREETVKATVYTGHSEAENTSTFATLLSDNNYEVETLEDNILTNIPEDTDVLVIAAPTSDFMGSELDVISEFLNNDGNLGKGLIYFADAVFTNLPNLNELLSQWGIVVGDGMLFETSGNYSSSDDTTTMITVPADDADLPSGIEVFITGYNVPLTVAETPDTSIETKVLVTTPETVVAAPIGVTSQWDGYDSADITSYPTVIQSTKTATVSGEEISSNVFAFASVEYVNSDWAERSETSNKAIALHCADIASGAGESDISFISKTIETESFTATASGTALVRVIFMVILPISVIVAGIIIFIRRRNA